MNEQLVVKNFGPIKDATVDFKRVTVFIGPTGGGKSTLAKLAAIFRKGMVDKTDISNENPSLREYSLQNHFCGTSLIQWNDDEGQILVNGQQLIRNDKRDALLERYNKQVKGPDAYNKAIEALKAYEEIEKKVKSTNPTDGIDTLKISLGELASKFLKEFHAVTAELAPTYVPAERSFVAGLEYSWAGLMRDNIGLSRVLLDFANNFSLSRKEISILSIDFLNIIYLHINGRDFIKIPEREEPLMLLEAASGIQSVTPLLVLLEHLSRNTEQAQSFIIEEPELNLFPTAQFELVKILVDKCARLDGQNDLVLTTHSPYVLTALNLLCYAFRIAQQDDATAKKVAKLIPRHCWIDPDQFAAYYVDLPGTKRKQQVRSIINKKTGLIEENELDTASYELSDIFDKLVSLRKPTKTTARVN